MKSSAYIIGAKRTPVAPRNGEHRNLEIFQLGTAAVAGALDDAGIQPRDVEEIVVGNALGSGGNPARLIALASGLPEEIAGLSTDRQCCSGLDAIILAEAIVAGGHCEVVLAGGAESYSRSPLRASAPINGGTPEPYDQARFTPWPDRDPNMAAAADTLAGILDISRECQDSWTVNSHAKAIGARGRLRAEICLTPKSDLEFDSYTRKLTHALCKRAKVISGTITVANTSVAADAAAFCVVASERFARKSGRRAYRIVSGKTLGGDPLLPGLAPVAAIESALHQGGMTASALSAAEIMEAYAAQAIACARKSQIDPAIINLGGGSLARGHPIGASGAVLAVRLINELRSRGGYGLAAIAAAGGLGTALVLEA